MEIPTEEAEVIIVYPPSRPGPGSSIYDPNNIIQMAKLMASWGNTVALAVSGAHFFLSSQWGILAGLVPATAPIAGPVAAGHGLAGPDVQDVPPDSDLGHFWYFDEASLRPGLDRGRGAGSRRRGAFRG